MKGRYEIGVWSSSMIKIRQPSPTSAWQRNGLCYATASILPWQIHQMKITLHLTTKCFIVAKFCSNSQELETLSASFLKEARRQRYISCIEQIDNIIAFSLFIDSSFIVIYIFFIHWDYHDDIWRFTKFISNY